jgi:hypothetical protein
VYVTGKKLTLAAGILLVAGWTVGAWAQNLDAGTIPPGTLTSLIAEIRALRVAVEQSGRAQTQAQALGAYLSVQQTRLSHLSGRREDARREVVSLSDQLQALTLEVSKMEEQGTPMTDPNLRAQFDRFLTEAKLRRQQISSRLQTARTRESELDQLTQTEEGRWTEIVTRLEQTTR